MEPDQRLFTRAEANALLPTLEPLVRQLRAAAATVRSAADAVSAFSARASATGGAQPAPSEERARRALLRGSDLVEETLRALHDHGVWVKDVERGLLDFPSRRDGEIVELCWLHGEPGVDHWHRIGEGFAGRRPLGEEEAAS